MLEIIERSRISRKRKNGSFKFSAQMNNDIWFGLHYGINPESFSYLKQVYQKLTRFRFQVKLEVESLSVKITKSPECAQCEHSWPS